HDRFSRTTIRLKGSHRPLDQLKLSANLAYADTRGHFVQRGNNVNAVQIPVLRTPPEFNNLPFLDPVFQQHRSYRFQHPTATSLGADRGFDNPFFALDEQINVSNVGRVFGNVGAEYLAISWLKFDWTLGADYTSNLFAVGRGLVAPTPYKLSNTVDRDLPVDNEVVIHRESYFGQATLDLYDQVYLTASLRNDGFSNFGRLSRRAWFPKASAAWT